jgi:PhnB protein
MEVGMESTRVTPHLCVAGVDAAIAFYRYVFDPREWGVAWGVVLHDEDPGRGLLGPKAIGGTAVTLNVDVDDVDGALARALAAGATSLRRLGNRRYGGRDGQFEDPFGHRWRITACNRDVPLAVARSAATVRGTAAPPSP